MHQSENNFEWSGRYQGVLCMILASLLFAVSGSLVKFLTLRLPAMEVVFFRFVVGVIVLAPWMIHQRIPFGGQNRPVLFFRSLCGFVAGGLSFYVTSKITLADAYLLTHSSPVFVALLSAVFFREYVPPRLYGLILLATLGCTFILRPRFDVVNMPGLLGLLAAVFAALAYLGIKKLHKTDSSATIVFHYSLFSTVTALLLFGRSFFSPTLKESLALLGCGLCATLAQMLMTRAYKFQDASEVSPYSYVTVLFSALCGILFWNEMPGWGTMIGGTLLIISGVGILKMRKPAAQIVTAQQTPLGKVVYE